MRYVAHFWDSKEHREEDTLGGVKSWILWYIAPVSQSQSHPIPKSTMPTQPVHICNKLRPDASHPVPSRSLFPKTPRMSSREIPRL